MPTQPENQTEEITLPSRPIENASPNSIEEILPDIRMEAEAISARAAEQAAEISSVAASGMEASESGGASAADTLHPGAGKEVREAAEPFRKEAAEKKEKVFEAIRESEKPGAAGSRMDAQKAYQEIRVIREQLKAGDLPDALRAELQGDLARLEQITANAPPEKLIRVADEPELVRVTDHVELTRVTDNDMPAAVEPFGRITVTQPAGAVQPGAAGNNAAGSRVDTQKAYKEMGIIRDQLKAADLPAALRAELENDLAKLQKSVGYGGREQLERVTDEPEMVRVNDEPELVRVTDDELDGPVGGGRRLLWQTPEQMAAQAAATERAARAKAAEAETVADQVPVEAVAESAPPTNEPAESPLGTPEELEALAARNVTFEEVPAASPTDPESFDLDVEPWVGPRIEPEAVPISITPEPVPAEAEPAAPEETPLAGFEREGDLKMLREDYVDATDRLNAWFSGSDLKSDYRGWFGNAAQNAREAVNIASKSEWKSRPQSQATDVVERAVKLMMHNKDLGEDVTVKDALGVYLKRSEFFKGQLDINSESGKRLVAAVEAKHAYEVKRTDLVKNMRERLVGEDKGIDMLEKYVLGEFEAQQAYREEKADPKKRKFLGKTAELLGKAYGKYASLPFALRFGIGIAAGSAISIGILGTGGLGLMGVGGVVGLRAARGASAYIMGKMGANVYGGVKRWWHGVESNERVGMALETGFDKAKNGLERFKALEAATQEVLKAKSVEAQIGRRKVLAGLLAGGLTAYEFGHVDQAVQQWWGGGQPDAVTLNGKGGQPETTAKSGAPGAEDAKTGSAESIAENKGFEVGKGGSIWQGVKEQVKSYVATDQASMDQLGIKMTPEQFKAFRADVMDGAKLSPDNARLLDRIVASSITKNHMMTMGIRNPGETVFWKPSADGGTIEFGSGNKALYDMNTGKPVSLDSLPKEGTGTQAGQAVQPSVRAGAVPDQGTRASSGGAQEVTASSSPEAGVAEIEVPAGQEWMIGLTQEQVDKADSLFSQFKRTFNIDLDDQSGPGQLGVDVLYKGVPADATGSVRVSITTPDNAVKEIVVPSELTRMRASITPTPDEYNHTVRDLVKNRIATKGSIDVIPPEPTKVVDLRAAPAATPKVIPAATPDLPPTPPINN